MRNCFTKSLHVVILPYGLVWSQYFLYPSNKKGKVLTGSRRHLLHSPLSCHKAVKNLQCANVGPPTDFPQIVLVAPIEGEIALFQSC